MFSDPQTVTINAVAQTLNRTSSGTNSGAFSKEDGLVKLSISHSLGKRNRRVVRLDHAKIAADPFLSGVSNRYNMAFYFVVDAPETGYTNAEIKQVADALVAYAAASSGANITKLLGGES
jgi:hypothetical protein